jgi:hypothetical protein
LKSSHICPCLVGEEEQGCRRPNSGEGGGWGGEGLAYGHQGLTAHPWVDLEGRGGDRRLGSHGDRGGGEEELVGEGLPGEEGGQARA